MSKVKDLADAIDSEQLLLIEYLLELGYHKDCRWRIWSSGFVVERCTFSDRNDCGCPYIFETSDEQIMELLRKYV